MKIKRWQLITAGAVIVVVLGGFWLFRGGHSASQVVTVTRGDIVQKVLVSGKVEAAQKAELAFEDSGAVRTIARRAGEPVKTGELIASLDTAELAVRLARQRASLEQEQLTLNNLLNPPVKDRLVAENALGQAQESVVQATSDRTSAMNTTLVDLPTVLNKVHDLVTAGNGYISDSSIRLAGNKARTYQIQAETAYWAAKKAYDVAKKNPDHNSIYQVARLTSTAIKDLYTLIAYLEDQGGETYTDEIAADKATLSTDTTTVNTDIENLLAEIHNVEAGERDVAEAEEKLRDLVNAAGTTDVSVQKLKVRQAELDVQDTGVQMAKRQIRAPFDGVVARNDLDLGQNVIAGTTVISVLSENQYQVVARVPEAEVTKIAVGNSAQVALDAYPASEPRLAAAVVAIDPAEVVVDGVATYKVTLQFATPSDPSTSLGASPQHEAGKVKSGMTASVEISGASRSDVLIIPERALNLQNGNYFVRVVQGQDFSDATERPVTVGLHGSDGNVEVLSGLTLGEQVAVGLTQ